MKQLRKGGGEEMRKVAQGAALKDEERGKMRVASVRGTEEESGRR